MKELEGGGGTQEQIFMCCLPEPFVTNNTMLLTELSTAVYQSRVTDRQVVRSGCYLSSIDREKQHPRQRVV